MNHNQPPDPIVVEKYIPVSCEVCHSEHYAELFNIAPRIIVQCENCGHEYVNPAPVFTSKDIYFFPSLEEDALNSQIDIAYITKILKKYRLLNNQPASPHVKEPLSGPHKLLDLGGGQGRLIPGLIQAGWLPQNLYLMDISTTALNTARERYKEINILEEDIYKVSGWKNYFDCILMVEFFEHMIYPGKVMEAALKMLKPEGLLIIRGLPNNMSFEAFVAGEKWKMRLSEKHYSFFNPDTFQIFTAHFPQLEVLEFGTYLQPGFRFYNLLRIAKDIGIFKKIPGSGGDGIHNHDNIDTQGLTYLILKRLETIDVNDYWYRGRINRQQLANLSTADDIESFFDKIHLDYLLSPDFSVVARKKE